MKISFVIPAYNAGAYLVECLDSIRALAMEEKEIIVVDDGSTDDTPSILARYDDAPVTVVSQKNMGLSMARNAGLARAMGDYICFVDADDVLLPADMSPILERMSERVDVIGINMVERDFSGMVHPYRRYVPEYDRVYTPAADFMRGRNLMPCAVAYIYRRTFLEEHALRFCPGIYHEDEEFTPRVFAIAQCFVAVAVTFYERRLHKESITTTTNKEKQQQKLRDMVTILLRLDAMHVDAMQCKLCWFAVDILRLLLRQRHGSAFDAEILSALRDAGYFPLRWQWNVKHILFNIFTRARYSLV